MMDKAEKLGKKLLLPIDTTIIWDILSANPSWFTAAALSPPPIIVVASVSAKAFATAIVPFARIGFGKMRYADYRRRYGIYFP